MGTRAAVAFCRDFNKLAGGCSSVCTQGGVVLQLFEGRGYIVGGFDKIVDVLRRGGKSNHIKKATRQQATSFRSHFQKLCCQ